MDRVRHDLDLYMMFRPLAGVGPVRRVEGRVTAWEDGRWRIVVALDDGEAMTVNGDGADSVTATVEALVAALAA